MAFTRPIRHMLLSFQCSYNITTDADSGSVLDALRHTRTLRIRYSEHSASLKNIVTASALNSDNISRATDLLSFPMSFSFPSPKDIMNRGNVSDMRMLLAMTTSKSSSHRNSISDILHSIHAFTDNLLIILHLSLFLLITKKLSCIHEEKFTKNVLFLFY